MSAKRAEKQDAPPPQPPRQEARLIKRGYDMRDLMRGWSIYEVEDFNAASDEYADRMTWHLIKESDRANSHVVLKVERVEGETIYFTNKSRLRTPVLSPATYNDLIMCTRWKQDVVPQSHTYPL